MRNYDPVKSLEKILLDEAPVTYWEPNKWYLILGV
jgi:hypothetical protein